MSTRLGAQSIRFQHFSYSVNSLFVGDTGLCYSACGSSHQSEIFGAFISPFDRMKISCFVVFGRLPRCLSGKESACQCRRHKRRGVDSWVGKILWSRKWQSTPVFLPGKFHEYFEVITKWPCFLKKYFIFGCAGYSLLHAGFL